MNKVNNFGGTLLRLERLKQNKGQKEVCYGICVPSYLSKIERNQVIPDVVILTQLFQRLGVNYQGDEIFIQKCNNLINLYYEQLSYSLDKTAYQELKLIEKKLSYSPLAIDWLLVKGTEENNPDIPLLLQCQSIMTDRQLAYYYLLHPLEQETVEQVIPLFIKAYHILNDSYSLLALMMANFVAGNYDKVLEYSDKCISLALEEGNTCNLAGCYQLIATVYACINAEDLMLPYYKRAIHLLQNTNWRGQINGIYYNIGATLISTHKYEQALYYLNLVEDEYPLIDLHSSSFLLNHKKALALIRSKKFKDAEKYLSYLKEFLESKNTKDTTLILEKMMLEEAYFECKENFLEDPKFVILLEQLMDLLKKKRHKGYSIFYRDILKEAYCKQRKYKKALDLNDEISLNI